MSLTNLLVQECLSKMSSSKVLKQCKLMSSVKRFVQISAKSVSA